jgi:hypothetical protein
MPIAGAVPPRIILVPSAAPPGHACWLETLTRVHVVSSTLYGSLALCVLMGRRPSQKTYRFAMPPPSPRALSRCLAAARKVRTLTHHPSSSLLRGLRRVAFEVCRLPSCWTNAHAARCTGSAHRALCVARLGEPTQGAPWAHPGRAAPANPRRRCPHCTLPPPATHLPTCAMPTPIFPLCKHARAAARRPFVTTRAPGARPATVQVVVRQRSPAMRGQALRPRPCLLRVCQEPLQSNQPAPLLPEARLCDHHAPSRFFLQRIGQRRVLARVKAGEARPPARVTARIDPRGPPPQVKAGVCPTSLPNVFLCAAGVGCRSSRLC